jgi:hypothetical protein
MGTASQDAQPLMTHSQGYHYSSVDFAWLKRAFGRQETGLSAKEETSNVKLASGDPCVWVPQQSARSMDELSASIARLALRLSSCQMH